MTPPIQEHAMTRREEIARIISRAVGLDYDVLPAVATYIERKSTSVAFADQDEILSVADAILALPAQAQSELSDLDDIALSLSNMGRVSDGNTVIAAAVELADLRAALAATPAQEMPAASKGTIANPEEVGQEAGGLFASATCDSPAPAPVADGEWVIGDRVEKFSGEARYAGQIVSVYQTTKGGTRYVVEVEPQGFQMICTAGMLRAASAPSHPDAIRQEREACAKIADAAKKSCATKASDARARNDTVAEGLFESACGEAFDIAAAIRAREP